jgi:hypothetical protein
MCGILRAILNFTPGHLGSMLWSQFSAIFCEKKLIIITSVPGVNFTSRGNLGPRGEICPLGGMFTPLFTPRGEHSLLFRRMEGRTENFTPSGITSPLGDKFHPLGTTSPLGSKFAPKGEVKNGPLSLPQNFSRRAVVRPWMHVCTYVSHSFKLNHKATFRHLILHN